MKRNRDDDDDDAAAVDITAIAESVPVLLAYILGFAFRDTFRLAQVSKQFYAATRRPEFWRYGIRQTLRELCDAVADWPPLAITRLCAAFDPFFAAWPATMPGYMKTMTLEDCVCWIFHTDSLCALSICESRARYGIAYKSRDRAMTYGWSFGNDVPFMTLYRTLCGSDNTMWGNISYGMLSHKCRLFVATGDATFYAVHSIPNTTDEGGIYPFWISYYDAERNARYEGACDRDHQPILSRCHKV
jgi:hypothetical protein